MSAAVQVLFDVSDFLGIQTAWLFLAMAQKSPFAHHEAFTAGPLFLLVSGLSNPRAVTSVKGIQQAAFFSMWKHLADPIDKRYAPWKKPLLKEASGVVIDLGSGTGQNIKYFDPSRITRLLLIEPNPGMHPRLAENARKAGFKDGQFEIVPCGAQEKARVEELTGIAPGRCDSVVSVLALCGIPGSRQCISALYDYLKPGGAFYFFEHVASKDPSTRKVQNAITPLWRFLFGGCEVNRATDKWILESFEWAEQKTFTVPIETQKCLDVKSYGWAKKP